MVYDSFSEAGQSYDPSIKGGLSFFLGGSILEHPSSMGYSSTLPEKNLSKHVSV